jgi:hypothetical protein
MKRLLILLSLCACEGLTTAPAPQLSVLKRMPEGCFAVATPDSPPAAALQLFGTCNYQADPTLMANVDEAVVVVDYGPDVQFDATTDVPPPVVTVTIDGAPADVPVSVGTVQRVGPRAYFEATLRAPAQLTNDLRIRAQVNAGFASDLVQPFAVVAPPLGVSLFECPDPASCELAGAVGDAHLLVSIPGDQPQQVTVRQSLAGVDDPNIVSATITPPASTVALAVPAAPDGSTWTISGSLLGGTPPSVTARIVAPGITAHLSCAPTCTLAPGDRLGLQIDTPLGIHATQAFVTTRLDGVPQLVGEPVAIDPGVLALTVPGSGAWTIDVSVAGYAAPAIVQNIP